MTSSIRRAARVAGLTGADQRAADSVLGPGHALTKAVANQHTLAPQSVVAALAVAAGVVGVVVDLPHAVLALSIGVATFAAFVLAWTVARGIVRTHARDLIAAGQDGVVLAVVARERRHLTSEKERERLARSLEAFHRDAVHWHEILPRFRPLQGVAQLRNTTSEVEALAAALRRDRVRVQGVALTARLLCDGHVSPLYADRLEPLRQELNRIRYLLEYTDADALADAEPQAA